MKRIVVVIALIESLLLVGAIFAGGVQAASDQPDKVFVCKYVGTPGEDERLQTGQNPISVSVNAIPDGATVGAYFADAQGRSFVLAFDIGQAEPDASECPGQEQPSASPSGEPSATPSVEPSPSASETPTPTPLPTPERTIIPRPTATPETTVAPAVGVTPPPTDTAVSDQVPSDGNPWYLAAAGVIATLTALTILRRPARSNRR